MRRGWFAAGVAFLALFAAAGYLASKLPLLDALGPGPGFFPLILAVLGGVLALVLIAQKMREPQAAAPSAVDDDPDDLIPDRAAIIRILGVVAVLAAAVFALDPLGYRLTALLFTSMVLLVLGARNVLAISAVSLALSFGVFHAFYYWLKVPLPIGEFGL